VRLQGVPGIGSVETLHSSDVLSTRDQPLDGKWTKSREYGWLQDRNPNAIKFGINN